ncbi:MAG: ATP-dependent zinc protease [Flavobacteriales bacterium]|nr:ATP-dependent zinc protease [Flavobacteriales bacterium]
MNLPVKIDSGAYTSSIHCYRATEVKVDGKMKLKCYFLSPKNKDYKNCIFIFDEYDTKVVKSSNGMAETRYSIKTKVKMFGKLYNIELTLAKRWHMKFQVLLGRKFLSNKFVIDTSQSNLSKKKTIKYYIYE